MNDEKSVGKPEFSLNVMVIYIMMSVMFMQVTPEKDALWWWCYPMLLLLLPVLTIATGIRFYKAYKASRSGE